MVTKPRIFSTRYFYHVYNCGINKNNIFFDQKDYSRFLETLEYYLYDQPLPYAQFKRLNLNQQKEYLLMTPKKVENQRVKIIVYCLMPNHFHLLLRPLRENGITIYVSDISNSYTKYFNVKNQRIGNLLQGPYKAKEISSEESLFQVSRYIHLNPVMSGGVVRVSGVLHPEAYEYSSYFAWVNPEKKSFLDHDELTSWLSLFGGSGKYREFVEAKLDRSKISAGLEELIFE